MYDDGVGVRGGAGVDETGWNGTGCCTSDQREEKGRRWNDTWRRRWKEEGIGRDDSEV